MFRLTLALYLTVSLSSISGIHGKDSILKLEVPENHGTQQIYNAFKLQPKEEHIGERAADLAARVGSEDNRKELDPFTAQCVHDFSLPCPESWTKNGSVCEAPPSYKGDCSRSVDTTEFSAEQKMLFMNDCKVKWPCKTAVDKTDVSYCKNADRNFLQPCPEGFLRHKQETGYVCVPDVSVYMGPCNGIVDFSNYSKESKMLWAQTCGTTWPCMTVCPHVFDKCPMDWKLNSTGACEAPPSYSGPCERQLYFTYYTQDMKRKKCMECEIPFECSTDCRKDYDSCPVMWKSENDGYCSPHSGALSCRDVLAELFKQSGKLLQDLGNVSFDFGQLDQESKKLFESKCNNVEFPCAENDDGINWSLSCPTGWTIARDDLRSCQPPSADENDACRSQVHFKNEEEKRAFASLCQINWSETVKPISHVTPARPNHDSGPINDLGAVHHIDREPGLSDSKASDQVKPQQTQKEPKETLISIKRMANVLGSIPYVVKRKDGQPRKLYKGFLREVHLLPGST